MNEAVLEPPSATGIRDEHEQLIIAELLGPAGGEDEEVVEDRVTERYVLGMLAPQGELARPEEQDSLPIEGEAPTEEGEHEPEAPAIPTIFPSSCGLTFAIDGRVTEISVTPRWGRYVRERSQVETDEGDPPLVWRRYPMGGKPLALELREGEIGPIAADPAQPEVVLRGRARHHDGDWLVTLFVVNEQGIPKQRRDEAWIFQVELSVEDREGRPIFHRRPEIELGLMGDEHETQMLAMLYRDNVEFAVGHGVSVHAVPDSDDPRRATRIETRAVPVYDVPLTEAPTVEEVPELAGIVLDMQALAELGDADLRAALNPLVDAYEGWIARQELRIDDPEARLVGFEDTAREALRRCRDAAGRVRAGIELVAGDAEAREAFRFANRAMSLQRVRSLAAQDRRRDSSLKLEDAVAARDLAENRSWRPFQLAFVLMNLPALVIPTHEDRSGGGRGLVDLLWFPTGGGKTEAYLGLTAFTLAIRRLQGVVGEYDGRDGVAAIMRYTLRLLTIQQFQRAAALICACEVIRRDEGHEKWGSAPFRIGLWVGQRATPNTTDEAEEWLRQARGATAYARSRSGSPAQLTFCPWCGSEINERSHIKVEKGLRRTLIYCGDIYGRCPFTERLAQYEGLPAVVVDEEIYRLLPALLIGTVDKFAQMPWRGPVETLFGQVTGRCERHGFRSPDLEDADSHPRRGPFPKAKTVPAGPLRPPDLIIQDELHLIAGPLGTMVGLYETAIDRLCAWKFDGQEVRPKVIASTATVRRAAEQVHAVFWRRLDVFPPSGLDASDSFFAVQREPTEEKPGRRYLGICAHGRPFKNVLIRTYVAQMGSAQYLFEKKGYGEAVDPYMTLVGYFNSLKDLGGMRRHVEDDVAARLGRIERRGLARRQRPFIEELTSRKGSGEIPRILDQVTVPFVRDRPAGSPAPIDVLLATNMISVGIDVPRLGAMVVAGQPKATAEYIQATSRIGREKPGLVLTVFGWARPRDLSHYERFEHYHATFYRQVEALSVTPFAPRATDRGLTALLVSLVRQLEPTWNGELEAENVDASSELAKEAVRSIRERAEELAAASDGDADRIAAALQQRLDEWSSLQDIEGRRLAYRDRKDGVTVGLLHGPSVAGWTTWTTLTSLRDVEPGVNLLLREDDLGEAAAPGFEFPVSEDVE